ncbi:MAG TPA: WxcM-like domain-containing protein [Vicinamibacterales bacterium]|jgi:UDP-2-acetamido-3-amino-2,3-dideoxy-glucuronate N-acetyltransferase|nr:WxcM-like domain-containing protein [Vicinamibacterales bacterium]
MAEHVTAPKLFVHPHALCESTAVGENTRIWAFAHVLPGATIGKDCNICDHVFIENDVVVGDRVTIKCGVQLWDGLRVADDVFIGPNVTFSNDKYPKSKQYQVKVEETYVGRGASIGGGASILPGLRIGARAMVGAGAVVTHDVPARAVVSGNPARIVGYVDAKRGAAAAPKIVAAQESNIGETSVGGVTIYRLPVFADLRGSLSVGEFPQQVPFVPRRYFIVYDVPGKDVRGEHAHRRCHQFLVCLRGSLSVVVDDGKSSEEIALDRPSIGLYLPPMVWAVQYRYSADALLLVFASEPYDAGDYIRDYDEFLSALGGAASA